MTTKLQQLTDRLEDIRQNNPTRDPATVMAKELGAVQGEISIELIKTLVKLDKTNQNLAKTNLRLQWAVVILALATVVITILK